MTTGYAGEGRQPLSSATRWWVELLDLRHVHRVVISPGTGPTGGSASTSIEALAVFV